mmetsp:Transcript_78/g.160  ORF Transcript_78/g.160 Transcript_78/m.160 type:complete len:119 (+) Transcript_78:88-444(+)
MAAVLRNIMLMQRDVPKAAKFYSEGLGLAVTVCTDRWAELHSGGTTIALKAVDSEAHCTTGYSPFLSFDVPDMDSKITHLISMGAVLDGPIKYPTHGKVAAMRAPDGHMFSLYEEARG